MGALDIFHDPESLGIIPRAIDQLFTQIDQKTRAIAPQGVGRYEESPFTVYCSFLQIYNEKLYDLLEDKAGTKPLVIREDKYAGIFVEG
jgi:hypothetical protein